MTRYRQTIDDIIAAACIVTGVAPDDFLGEKQTRLTAYARQIAGYVCRQRKYSYPEIGRAFRRDHSTIICSVKKTDAALAAKDKDVIVDVRCVSELASAFATQRMVAC